MHPANTTLVREEADGIVTLTMNRPRQLNAMSEALLGDLGEAFAALAGDAHVRCVVLAGAGTAFCAGHDLREMRCTPDLAYYRDLFSRMLRRDAGDPGGTVPVPVIARVHGLATAAGCQLVAACDLAIAAESARFCRLRHQPRAVLRDALGGVVAQRADETRLRHADDRPLRGRRDGGRLRDCVNEAVADAALDTAVAAKAATIAAKPPAAVRTGKALFYKQREAALAEAYTLAGEAMAQNMMDEDTREGIDAFLEKRAPAWAHRHEFVV